MLTQPFGLRPSTCLRKPMLSSLSCRSIRGWVDRPACRQARAPRHEPAATTRRDLDASPCSAAHHLAHLGCSRCREGRPVWSGVKPLADELAGVQDEFGKLRCVMYPTSRSLPGGPCPWEHKDSFKDGARPSVLFASHRTDGWEVSVSIVGPDLAEMEVLTFRFRAAEVLENIRSGRQEALDSEAAPVLGVTRYDICGYRGNE